MNKPFAPDQKWGQVYGLGRAAYEQDGRIYDRGYNLLDNFGMEIVTSAHDLGRLPSVSADEIRPDNALPQTPEQRIGRMEEELREARAESPPEPPPAPPEREEYAAPREIVRRKRTASFERMTAQQIREMVEDHGGTYITKAIGIEFLREL